MNILVVGSGAREHVIVWKCIQSELVDRIFCAPGNAGIDAIAQLVDIKVTDIHGLAEFARAKHIDLTIVGPEVPLVDGIVDRFKVEGLRVVGPTKDAAIIEGNKLFAKSLMTAYGIPTSRYETFSDVDPDMVAWMAKEHIKNNGVPCVIKARGLAAGRGVIVAQTMEDALSGVDTIAHTEAGRTLLVEEFLEGWECSFIVATDGKNVVPLVPSQDYKRAYDGDKGPNTGGMGAHTLSAIDPDLYEEMLWIMKRVVIALCEEGSPYKGFLYGGFMITDEGPKVLEFNCRLGDPEAQVILPMLKSDFVEMCLAIENGTLDTHEAQWSEEAFVNVVVASAGYPAMPQVGDIIYDLEEAAKEGALVFHAGTEKNDSGELLTIGGRVLSVVGHGDDIVTARDMAYRAIRHISFGDKNPIKGSQWYRSDIAQDV